MKKEKPTILVCTDSPVVSTGFGQVCYSLVTRWLKTGKYKVVCMGTNDRAEYHPLRNQYGDDLIIEPLPYIGEDPYGLHRMPEILRKYNPDIIFSLNDIWVWTGDERHPQMDNWFYKHIKSYKPYVPWIGYFPTDGRLWDQKWVQLLNEMTYACTFTDYGYKVLSETDNVKMDKVRAVYHGHRHEDFYPVDERDVKKYRKQMGIDDDAFLITMVGRNQPRKGVPLLIYAFKMFKDGFVYCDKCGFPRNLEVMKDCELCGSEGHIPGRDGVKNAYLYLHMNLLDMRGYKLPKIIRDNKLTNIVSRTNHDVAVGVPIEELNMIYNASNVVVNPATAGGYELPPAEAQAAGRPVICTHSTSMKELMDNDFGKCGYSVLPSTFYIAEDAAHTPKHIISLKGLVETLYHIYDNPEEAKEVGERAASFAKSRNWDKSANEFEQLIDSALETAIHLDELLVKDKFNVTIVNESNNFGQILDSIPAIKKIIEVDGKRVNFVLAVKNRFAKLMSKLIPDIDVLDVDRMWLDNDVLKDYQLQLSAITEIPMKHESIAPVIGSDNLLSHIEAYLKGFNQDINVKNLDKILDVLDDNKFDFGEFKDKLKITFIVNAHDPNSGLPIETYAKTIKFLQKFEDVCTIAIGYSDALKLVDSNIKVSDKTLSEIISLLKDSDCIVTSDDEYVHLANYINVPFVIIQGPRKFNHIVKHSLAQNINGKKLIYFVDASARYQRCMPCWKTSQDKCAVSGTQMSHCMSSIAAGEIFGKILNIRTEYQSGKVKK